MNILLTGCAGFIGARTTELLLESGCKVIGLDNLNNYYDPQLKEYRLSKLQSMKGFRFEKIDIEDQSSLEDLFRRHQFDAIINLAARAGVRASIVEPDVYLSTNTQGALNLLRLATKYRVTKYVMASTSSLYAGAPMPFVETADVTRPISPYAVSKLAAESLAYTWHHLYGINVSILRYFTVFGPAGRPDMSPFRFIEWVRRREAITLYGDGSQTRDFTYIDDIASGTIAALNIAGYEIINLGGGNSPLSISQMINFIEDKLQIKATIHKETSSDADMKDTSAEIGKASALLNWHPKTDPFEGFRRTIAWHKSNASWLTNIKL